MSSIANPLTSHSLIGHTAGSTTSSSGSTTSSPGSSSGTAGSNPGDPLANESTFLTLLVSQLQNQDPLSPTDSNQFVSQLTSYSQLEQLIGIHNNTTTLAGASSTGTSATGTSTTGTTGTTSTTGS